MAYKIFLDINVLLDFFLKRKDFKAVEQILLLGKKREIKLFVNPSIIQTVSYYLQRNFDTQSCKLLLIELLKIVNVIETSQEIINQALNSSMDDIEDAIHYFTAIKHKMDYLISGDKDFQQAELSSLPILTINEIIEKLVP